MIEHGLLIVSVQFMALNRRTKDAAKAQELC